MTTATIIAACKKNDIPRPAQGYWQRLARGCAGAPVPLPDKKESGKIDLASKKWGQKGSAILNVPKRLTSPHRLVEYTRGVKTGYTDNLPNDAWSLNVQVSDTLLPRALRIMDTLVKTFEKRGYEVVEGRSSITPKGKPQKMHLVNFGLHELNRRTKSRTSMGVNYHSQPTGILELELSGIIWEGYRKVWRDGKTRQVEDCISQAVDAAIYSEQKWREYWDEQDARREVEQKQRAEEQHALRVQRERPDELVRDANAWHQANIIRQYVDAMRGEKGEAWAEWALIQADKLE